MKAFRGLAWIYMKWFVSSKESSGLAAGRGLGVPRTLVKGRGNALKRRRNQVDLQLGVPRTLVKGRGNALFRRRNQGDLQQGAD